MELFECPNRCFPECLPHECTGKTRTCLHVPAGAADFALAAAATAAAAFAAADTGDGVDDRLAGWGLAMGAAVLAAWAFTCASNVWICFPVNVSCSSNEAAKA